jgi:hypothetical protein
MSRKSFLLRVSLSICALAVPQVKGQEPLNAADSARIGHFLDSDRSPDLLHCRIRPQKPTFDFAFRFDAGYIVSCPLSRFGGRASKVLIFARVAPDGGKPLLLGDTYRWREAPVGIKSANLIHRVEMSGGFAVGEGKYQVEVLVVDQETGRTSRKSWRTLVARPTGHVAAQVAVPPGSVIPLGVLPWPIKMDTIGKGLRVTVLLDAASLNPRSPSLGAWDRTSLLESLLSMLNQVPCASVRLRAFNLGQHRELFRQDQFDHAGFMKLTESLRSLELGKVSVHVLQRRRGWLEMLADYANGELLAANPSDAVIILGPRTRYYGEFPAEILKGRKAPIPHFYYFEYYPGFLWGRGQRFIGGADRPETLSSLTRRLDGTVYAFSTPSDLAHCIQKMLAQLQPQTDAARIHRDVVIVDHDRTENCKGEGHKTPREQQHAANDLHQKDLIEIGKLRGFYPRRGERGIGNPYDRSVCHNLRDARASDGKMSQYDRLCLLGRRLQNARVRGAHPPVLPWAA